MHTMEEYPDYVDVAFGQVWKTRTLALLDIIADHWASGLLTFAIFPQIY